MIRRTFVQLLGLLAVRPKVGVARAKEATRVRNVLIRFRQPGSLTILHRTKDDTDITTVESLAPMYFRPPPQG